MDMETFARTYVDGHGFARSETFPDTIWRALAAAGLFRIGLPQQHGGSDGGYAAIAAGEQALAQHGGVLGLTMSWTGHQLVARHCLVGFASPAQCAHWLPRIADGTLVAPDKLKFPALASVNVATVPHKAYHANYGPDFISRGIVSQEPPAIGSVFPILVPQVDADGNELAGIRVPELAVPLATYTGWNLFNERSGPTDVLSSMQGSFIPLARTRSERERVSDPRRSVEERYSTREQYLAQITKAANDLVTKGYLLKEDVPGIVEQAKTRWEYVVAATSSQQ